MCFVSHNILAVAMFDFGDMGTLLAVLCMAFMADICNTYKSLLPPSSLAEPTSSQGSHSSPILTLN